MAEKTKRDTSPLVFVRNPHSFAPLSAQRIPPPPSWKPPPLPKDLDVNSSKNDQNAIKECNVDLGKDDRTKLIPSDSASPAASTAKPITTFTKDSIGDAEEMSLTPTKEDHSTGFSPKVENYLEDSIESIQKHDNSDSAGICEEEGNLEKRVNPKDTKEVNINLISDQPTIPCDSISAVTNTSEPFTSLMNNSTIDTVEINIIPPEKDNSIDGSSKADNYIKERLQTQAIDYNADICQEDEVLQGSVKLDETKECTIQSLDDETTIRSDSISADAKTVTCLENTSIMDKMETFITPTEKVDSIDLSSTATNNLEYCLQAPDINYIATVCENEENETTPLKLEENTSVEEVKSNEIIPDKTSTEISEEHIDVNVESPDLESSKPLSKNIVNIDDNSRVSNNKTDTNGDKSKQDKIEDTKLEKKCKADVNDNKRHKKLASISISKLEEELDSLPIPEFPSLYTTDELDILPMSQYPVPSDAITQDCAAVIQQDVDVSPGQKYASSPTMSPSNNESSNDLIEIRSNRVSIKSMSANLENITSHLHTTTRESTENPLEKQDNASFTDNTISKENSHLNKNQNGINNTTSILEETNGPSNHTAALQDVQTNRQKWDAKPTIFRNQPEREIKKEIDDSPRRQKEHSETIKSLKKLEINESKDLDRNNPTRASVISRIKSKATNDRRNSLVKTLTRIEPYLLFASSPPEGIRSQRLAELGVSYVVHAATMLGSNNKIKGMLTSHSDGIDISNANLEEGGNNFEIFDAFADKIAQVQKKKGVALVISDETSPSINQRYVYFKGWVT